MIRGLIIKDANGRLSRTMAAITLTVETGDLATEEHFLVCETQSVPCILGCTCINTYVDAIRPGRRVVELQDSEETKRGWTAVVRDLTLGGSVAQ